MAPISGEKKRDDVSKIESANAKTIIGKQSTESHGPGGENSPHDEVATDANHSADAIPEVPVQQPNVPPEGLAVNNKVPSLDEFVNIGQIVFGHGPGGENSPHDEVATDANHPADGIPEVPVQQPNVPPEGLAVNNKVLSLDEFEVEVVNNDPVDRGAENAVKSNIEQKQTSMKIMRGNNEFQHYYFHHSPMPMGCEKCEKVQQLIDHKKSCRSNACPTCQFINDVISCHKEKCEIEECCFFCLSMNEGQTVDDTNSLSEAEDCDRISVVIAQIPGGHVQEGTPFIKGKHYTLEDNLGEGGFGVVKRAKLLEPGKELFRLNNNCNIQLAAKIANIDDNEKQVLKKLANGPFIAPHYFIVDCNQEVLKMNYKKKKKKKELKTFQHILFMQCAEKSLRGFQNELQYRILPPKEAAIFLRQIVHAVAYCHSKEVSHNDIKPDNVLLFSNDNNQKSANLCDFEFAARKGCQRGRVGGTKLFRPTKPKYWYSNDVHAVGYVYLQLTFVRASHPPHSSSELLDEFKNELVKELIRKHHRVGELIKECLEQTITVDVLKRRLYKIGVDEKWWPSNVLGL